MARTDFYHVFIPNHPRFAMARALPDPDIGKQLRAGEVLDWKTLHFHVEKGEVTDYLANSLAFRLCSAKLRDLIDANRSPTDDTQWLASELTLPNGTHVPYAVLHFPTVSDVLHESRSVVSGSMLVKPVLDAAKVSGHTVIGLPHDSVALIVADSIR